MPLALTKEEVATAENAVRAFVHGTKGFQSLLADLRPVVWNITSADIVETLLHFMTMDDLAEWKKPATGSTLYMHLGELTKSRAGVRLLTGLMVYACFVSYDDSDLFVHVIVHASENAADTIASMDDWSTRRGILKITDRTETLLKQAAALAPPADKAAENAKRMILAMPGGTGRKVEDPKPNEKFKHMIGQRDAPEGVAVTVYPELLEAYDGRPSASGSGSGSGSGDGSAAVMLILILIVGVGLAMR
jgi:hypothetical protein